MQIDSAQRTTILLFICLLTIALSKTNNSESLTYTTDVTKPIFKNRCSECHDHMVARNWQVYDNAFSYRYAIKERILSRTMPMGRDMPQKERDLIVKWVDQGAKK